ncbi:RNA-directed DNA polymerase from mobile element jockey [Trichonephila clavipes]|nr:RNA-directed DNA polymerase from mobile element jockey [Trichonephila clavipes]
MRTDFDPKFVKSATLYQNKTLIRSYARNTPENNRKFPDKDFLKILNSGQNIIIAGDLNAAHRTWSNARSNALGYALRKIVNNKSNVRIVAPHTPTHINASSRPGARDSIIDLAVLKNIPFNHDIRVIDDLESGHLPVILTLYTGSALIKIPDQLSTNWENFKFLLNNKPLPIPPSSSNDDLEIAIRRLGENISEALIEASKPKFKQPSLKLPSERTVISLRIGRLPWWSPYLNPKNSDDTKPQNYRPISLLSSLSKAYEFVLLNRLNQHCITRNIIIPEQHGFVTQCSTVTQLLRVTELIHHGFQNNQATGMLFVDIAKAFDKIWHDGLLYKMMRLGFSDQLIKIVHYLNSREFRVRVENSLSTPRLILRGVPQGSLLGPKLFNLYINDIPKAVGVHLAMYADDTVIFAQNIYNCNIIERLQNYVIRLETWLNDWKIKINASKSACLLFTRQRCIGNLPHVNIFHQPVPWVTEYKYLGLILDTKLNFAKHIRSAHQRAAGMRCT